VVLISDETCYKEPENVEASRELTSTHKTPYQTATTRVGESCRVTACFIHLSAFRIININWISRDFRMLSVMRILGSFVEEGMSAIPLESVG
jgi:hypothetical protein